MHDQMKITVIATGFDSSRQKLKEFVSPSFGTSTPVQSSEPEETKPEETPSEPERKEPVGEEDDVWDIPAFLRQKN